MRDHWKSGQRVHHGMLDHSGTVVDDMHHPQSERTVWVLYDRHQNPVLTEKRTLRKI